MPKQFRSTLHALMLWRWKGLLILSLTFLSLLTCRAAAEQVDSLDIKIGQMLMIGFRGATVSDQSPVAKAISDLHIGGVVLFDFDVATKAYGRNITSPMQLMELTNGLRRRAEIPLFIAVDQEGGTVRRLKSKDGFPQTVSAAKLGAMDNADSTSYYSDILARSIAVVGINTNFAPVLDLNVNPQNPVIGKLDRSFSAVPDVVSRNAALMIDAHHARGVLCAVKHFPGHGSSRDDSHEGFVDVSDTWTKKELEPFATIIGKGGADMVMTAHIFNRKLDPEYPGTLSKATIDGLLRTQMAYDGVVVTDDLMMKAITDKYGLETAIEKAVNAGADILLFANNTFTFDPDIAQKAFTTLKSLVASGRITPARIEASWQRIMNLKGRMTKTWDK
ncbi:MAG: glycoside hydrolase family 3 [Bacteroidetes bacterium]|nr:glycoside hydrolase family 3 [Bacteroidota bacterium]